LGTATAARAQSCAFAQEQLAAPNLVRTTCCAPPARYTPPAPTPLDKPLPINLATALRLSNVRPVDIAIASQRVKLAVPQLQRAEVLWLPTILLGTDYFRHDGQIQDVAGNVFGTSKSAFMVGCGPSAVFAVTDALFEPLAQRQVLRARAAGLQAAQNDSLLAVAEAYFNVHQALGQLAGALDSAGKADQLVRAVEKLAPGLVQATLRRERQERFRPFLPSVLLRGAATNPAGTLAAGAFGGGLNSLLGKFSARSDFDVQVLWEWQNLGFSNRARVNERRAENQLASLDFIRIRDQVAAEVAQAYAQARAAANSLGEAEVELRNAVESYKRNLEGLNQTQRNAGKIVRLVVRPQEVAAAVQALAQAYADNYGAVGDYDRARFRLYHALGHPAQLVTGNGGLCTARADQAAAVGELTPTPPGDRKESPGACLIPPP
jgi:outer membrane protein TolC